jgi:hypothetical protein
LIKIYAKKEIKITASRDDYFRFGLVFIKKIIKSKFFKKNQNQVKPIWLGFLDFSSVFSGFGSVFRFGSGFFPGFFGLVSVRFFWFFAYETEPKKTKKNRAKPSQNRKNRAKTRKNRAKPV